MNDFITTLTPAQATAVHYYAAKRGLLNLAGLVEPCIPQGGKVSVNLSQRMDIEAALDSMWDFYGDKPVHCKDDDAEVTSDQTMRTASDAKTVEVTTTFFCTCGHMYKVVDHEPIEWFV